MISEAEYLELDGIAQAELVRRGEVSASELLEAAIARAEKVNPQLNAIVIPMYEVARTRATSALSGTFAGVPFLLKDLFQDYAGVAATAGTLALKVAGAQPTRHAEIVVRHLAAGLVIFGRTNTPEFGAKGITEPEAWGITRNPWNLEHSPGGSSGGSAAAVAAGIVPMAAGSDGGGSIRIPAACTGLFGLKPGRGRTPSGPGKGEAVHGAAMNHVLTRSVRDSAAMLDATHGPECGSLYRLAPPDRPYLEQSRRDPPQLRIAFSTRSPLELPVHPSAVAAAEQTAKLLESLGHHVEAAEPAIDGQQLARDFLCIWFAQLSQLIAAVRAQYPQYSQHFEMDSLAMEAMAQITTAPEYAASYVRWCRYGYLLDSFLQRYDVYLTPTMAAPPPRIGQNKTPNWINSGLRALLPLGLSRVLPLARSTFEELVLRNLRGVPFTQLANVTGVPAMSVPLHSHANGLPLGMQFLGAHGSEGLLLNLAGQLERAVPWAARRPTL